MQVQMQMQIEMQIEMQMQMQMQVQVQMHVQMAPQLHTRVWCGAAVWVHGGTWGCDPATRSLLHRATHLAVRRGARVVLVCGREEPCRRERLPVRVEVTHHRPLARCRTEVGRRRPCAVVSGTLSHGSLLLVECAEGLGVHGVEAALAVAEALERRRGEQRPQVYPALLLVAIVATAAANAPAATQDGLTVLVVPAALVLVAQHGVRVLDLLELLGGQLLRSTGRQ